MNMSTRRKMSNTNKQKTCNTDFANLKAKRTATTQKKKRNAKIIQIQKVNARALASMRAKVYQRGLKAQTNLANGADNTKSKNEISVAIF